MNFDLSSQSVWGELSREVGILLAGGVGILLAGSDMVLNASWKLTPLSRCFFPIAIHVD